jgi:hypothetical protein
MNTKKIMKEFMTLGYSGPGVRTDRVEDTVLGNYIILRTSYNGFQIIWLGNGNKLSIPWKIVDLFTSLNVGCGEKIIWEGYDEEADIVERLIYLFVLLINEFNWSRGKDFLETLGTICELGTIELREWIETEFKEKLPPLELITVEKTTLI